MKKTFALLLSMLLVTLLLAACGGKAKEEGGASPSAASPSAGSSAAAGEAAPDVPLPKGANVAAVKQLPSKPLRIAFLSWQNNPFWFPVRDGAQAAKDYLKNFNTTVDYVVMGDDLTADRTVSAMETAITQKYDGIVVVPIFDGTEVVINKAIDAGIPVLTAVAEGAKPSKRIAFMGQDAYAAGQLAGQQIEKLTGGSGKIGVITGVFGATQHEKRMNGALDYLKEKVPGIQVVGKYENKDKAETAYSLTKDMITANPDLKVVYVTAGGPFGAAKAIQDLGLTGKVSVVCYDHIPENVKYVRSGEIAAAIAQDPFGQGFDSIVTMYNYLAAGQKPSADFLPVKLDVLTPDNVNELFPE
ncbi:sugar ABC transporter substrate-binding protein [Cohnella caldifontis]|uniref:sugar ABC transporter substrate-binding protein n=1 Tax=Cohnella caldifontis TaxID=3027471 RepID=UPI0023EB6477|nr:sugar ABC transporter substrate-binding protein [Cohnella sp. YIM B05605]